MRGGTRADKFKKREILVSSEYRVKIFYIRDRSQIDIRRYFVGHIGWLAGNNYSGMNFL